MINVELLIVPVIFLISFLIVLRKYNRDLSPYSMKSRMAVSKISSRLNEVITGMHVVRGASQEQKEKGIFNKNIEEFKDVNVKLGVIQAKYYPLLMLGIAML